MNTAGHIACDSVSQSEIVVPIVVPRTRLSSMHQAAIRGEGPEPYVRAWAGRVQRMTTSLWVCLISTVSHRTALIPRMQERYKISCIVSLKPVTGASIKRLLTTPYTNVRTITACYILFHCRPFFTRSG